MINLLGGVIVVILIAAYVLHPPTGRNCHASISVSESDSHSRWTP